MEIKKKKLAYALVVGASFAVISAFPSNYDYNPCYEITENNLAYARYSLGYVYIGDQNFLNSIDAKENDILVLDEREENLNVKIINSYLVEDANVRNEILCIIQEYEKEYPTAWERSLESMRTEWAVHNFFYNMHMRKTSTVDVDFENNEEKLYKGKVLAKYFK